MSLHGRQIGHYTLSISELFYTSSDGHMHERGLQNTDRSVHFALGGLKY